MLSSRYGRVAVLVIIAVCLVGGGGGQHVLAQDDPAAGSENGQRTDTSERLNFVDRQLMLNEMMAKSICYTDMRVDRKKHRNQLALAQFVFKETLQNLISGNEALQIQPETDFKLRSAIGKLQGAWLNYTSTITSWSNARWGRKLFALKAYEVNEDFNTKLLKTIEDYRQSLLTDGAISKSAVAGLLLAGRQRMLTQKISKEFCQIATGLNVEPSRKLLSQSLSQFEASADKLIKGDKELGLYDEPPGEVIDSIEKARSVFATVEPILVKAAAGSQPSEDDLEFVANANDELLKHWVTTVSIYQVAVAP